MNYGLGIYGHIGKEVIQLFHFDLCGVIFLDCDAANIHTVLLLFLLNFQVFCSGKVGNDVSRIGSPIHHLKWEVILMNLRSCLSHNGRIDDISGQAVNGLHICGQLLLEMYDLSDVWSYDFSARLYGNDAIMFAVIGLVMVVHFQHRNAALGQFSANLWLGFCHS